MAEAPHVKYVVDDQSRDDVHYERYGVAIGYILRDQIYIYITQLESRLAQVERERDAAVADMHMAFRKSDVCCTCKYEAGESNDCMDCIGTCNWQWRGVCPENTKEE